MSEKVIRLETASCAHCRHSFVRRAMDSCETLCPRCRKQLRVIAEAIERDDVLADLLNFNGPNLTGGLYGRHLKKSFSRRGRRR